MPPPTAGIDFGALGAQGSSLSPETLFFWVFLQGDGDDDGNDAMAVRLMTAMKAMTLWKRTVRDVPKPARVQVSDRQ